MILHHRGHVAELQAPGGGAIGHDRHLGQVLGGADGLEVLDAQALVRGVDEAARTRRVRVEEGQGREPQCVASGLDDLVEGDALRLEFGRVDEHLELALALAPDGHVGDARHAHQGRPDRPAGEDRHVDRRHVLRCQADHHHAARRRERLEHGGGLRDVGQRMRLGESLGDHLPGTEDVRARLEDEHDRREAGHGLRADRVQPGDAVQQIGLERHRDELLDLFSRQPERLGLDLDVRGRELGHHVDRHLAQRGDAEDEEADRQADHDEPVPQAPTDDRSSHPRALRPTCHRGGSTIDHQARCTEAPIRKVHQSRVSPMTMVHACTGPDVDRRGRGQTSRTSWFSTA
jgi:hypothetical protein